ncbi:MAG: peptidoglycan-binding protein [Patescibacteria group bacterium]
MFKNYKKKIILVAILLLSLAVFASSNSAFAQTATSTATQLQELVNKLLAQVAALQEQMTKIKTQQQEVTQTISEIAVTLKEGDRGENVKTLQALLAADSSIYPEGLITGFYGPLTTKAIRKFQEKHSLEKVGFVGPKTKLKLNELLKEHPLAFEKAEKEKSDDDKISNAGRLCAIVPPGHLIAPGWLKKQKDEQPIIPLCQILPIGIAKKLEQATSTPDTTAPIISAISVNATTSTATITWTTNEASTSKAYYSTISPLDVSSTSTLSVSTLTLSMSHLLGLSGLTASSTYYFAVESKNAANNTATSTGQSFTTSQ